MGSAAIEEVLLQIKLTLISIAHDKHDKNSIRSRIELFFVT